MQPRLPLSRTSRSHQIAGGRCTIRLGVLASLILLLSAAFAIAAPPPVHVRTRSRHVRLRDAGLRSATLRGGTAARGALLHPGILPVNDAEVPDDGNKYELRLHHLHSGETLDVVYRIGDTYLPGAIEELNHFLRDSRTQDEKAYDPSEFDLLHNLMTRLGKPQGMIDIVCGYRTAQSNEFLRTRGPDTGVAKNSQHVQAKAIDIQVPGVRTRRVRDAALSLQAGGVGYYPRSRFVHVDVGPVRRWTFSGRGD